MLALKIQTMFDSPLTSMDEYEYLLGICSDGLYVLNLEKTEIVDVIVSGNSKDCTLCSAPDENTFLEVITVIKEVLSNGLNPLTIIQFGQ
jgi:hypothetical protein